MDDPADSPSAKLRIIADTLGIPVEGFFADTGEEAQRLVEAGECVRLWDRIKTAEGRRRALAYLRLLADEPMA